MLGARLGGFLPYTLKCRYPNYRLEQISIFFFRLIIAKPFTRNASLLLLSG